MEIKTFCTDDEETDREAILVFKLPAAEDDFLDALKGSEYSGALWDIHQRCRLEWKYAENPSDDCLKLAHDIQNLINETDVMAR